MHHQNKSLNLKRTIKNYWIKIKISSTNSKTKMRLLQNSA